MIEDRDVLFMERALLLAERGVGRTSPNPIVGAVAVSADGVIVGQGAHLVAGGPHAEVAALDGAGRRARGGTLYCTLEPCAHVGRTGPCAERIVGAGIRRVVLAAGDPNPLVSGRGIAYLRAHHVEVEEGVLRERALVQNAPFFTWISENRPFVTAKVATSRDGFVARLDGRVKLTGPAADRFFHRQRAEVDAIAVGSGTVVTDDPELTARGAYRSRALTRVLFDWSGRIPPRARVFSTLTTGPVIMVVDKEAVAVRRAHFGELTARGVMIDARDRRDLDTVLRRLAARGIVGLLVEGGPRLHQAFAEADLIDRVQMVTTPKVLGTGVPSGLQGFAGTRRTRMLGDDTLVEIDVHGTGGSNRTH